MKTAVKFLVVLFILCTSVTFAAHNELASVWVNVAVKDIEVYFVDGYHEVGYVFGEVLQIGNYDDTSEKQVEGVNHLLQNSKKLQMSVFCSNTKQEKFHEIFLNRNLRPNVLKVKLSVWKNNAGKTLVSIVDHNL